MSNSVTLYSMPDMERMASAIVKSNLFGIKTVDQGLTLMLIAQAEGLHPAVAARDYHIIQGRPALKADAMLARFQQAGGIVEWQDYEDARVSATFRHPNAPKPVLIVWTLDMAKKIGLTGKQTWQQYPRQMLRARVISEGVRTCYPAIATGVYTPEEVEDFAKEKDITPTAGALSALTGERQSVVAETAAQIRAAMADDDAYKAFELYQSIDDADEYAAMQSMLDSKVRSALRRMADADRAQAAGKISEAQKRRLEARIKELKLDRAFIKAHCAENYGVEHFSDLTPDAYKELDAFIDKQPPPQAPFSGNAQPSPATPAPVGGDPIAAAQNCETVRTQADSSTPAVGSASLQPYITPDQFIHLSDELRGIKDGAKRLCAAAKVTTLNKLPADGYQKALAWIEKAKNV